MKRFFRWLKSKFKTKNNYRPVKNVKLTGQYPDAIYFEDLPLLKCPYKFKDWPRFYIVHYTAGHQDRTGRGFMKSFLKKGYCADFIDMDGNVFQQRHGNRSGYHAGKSRWGKYKSLNKYSAGVEIACGGKLEIRKIGTKDEPKSYSMPSIPDGHELVTWFGKKVNNARFDVNASSPGWYEPYTEKQEQALAKLLAWQIKMGVSPFNILGHDDISPGRKSDPGGSLSMPLQLFVKEKVMPLIKSEENEEFILGI